ncbi:hypothetical protein DL764_004175 [Monosporascus ibericus]|uniref:FAM50A/XAP5 C-terminal domain-containing protein n=1 Tax=Monosporascus ibericus TaxID=155417 RepID=A0A4Q4TDU6_9PEZI|nr:hypothetical protein DL764_004175 [Monosporascus ibericus]
MSAPSESRFTSQNKTTQERLSSNTVGLVALSDFRKRRAEVLEQQEREAREAVSVSASASVSASTPGTPANTTPDRSLTSTPDTVSNANKPRDSSDASLPQKKRKKSATTKKVGVPKLSFGEGDNEGGGDNHGGDDRDTNGWSRAEFKNGKGGKTAKFKANSSVSVVPRSLTKSALRREAAERELLRREFLARQEAVKATEIAIPFVFYDGTNIPGGTVRVKKGDYIWVFLDRSRKMGADLGVGDKANSLREWARVGVDDLMLVRGNVIIPHHYDFLFFIMNKTIGPDGKPLFGYSAEAPRTMAIEANTVEGASDDPSYTKVIDRRWYERNKHIYPASVWQDFDPDKDYQREVRRDVEDYQAEVIAAAEDQGSELEGEFFPQSPDGLQIPDNPARLPCELRNSQQDDPQCAKRPNGEEFARI